jgi:formate dehydrogenase iron-sulfur subunit
MSGDTFTIIKYKEVYEGDKLLDWLFFKDQCRHCLEPACKSINEKFPGAVKQLESGAVLHTDKSKGAKADEVDCPYEIPRNNAAGFLRKCTLCWDRVENGELPACVKTCTGGALQFGDRGEMLAKAKARLVEVKKKFPNAHLAEGFEEITVVHLLIDTDDRYAARVQPDKKVKVASKPRRWSKPRKRRTVRA